MSDRTGSNAEALKGHLELLLLAALELQPAHGYAIAENLRTRSDRAFNLPEGTLYPALHRLERAGLLSSRWSDDTGRRRRVYQLTAKGHRALAQRRTGWRDFSRAVQAVIGGRA
jgi:transcriptional regulator